jgi:acetyltransferase-like isoleucine patch superfamily enzyme
MRLLKTITYIFLWCIGRLWSYVYSYPLARSFDKVKTKLYSAWVSKEFKSFGYGSVIQRHIYLIGGNYISIGTKTGIGLRAVLTARDKYKSDTFHPLINIGNNVSIGDDSHITAINRIEIGNNVLAGKKITITDNSHGKSNFDTMFLPPSDRPLYTAGPVIIEDGVWIGDKVSILPNVRIGKNAIIGSNAVVTKDIPANCVAVGIPAKVIKVIE